MCMGYSGPDSDRRSLGAYTQRLITQMPTAAPAFALPWDQDVLLNLLVCQPIAYPAQHPAEQLHNR